MSTTMARVTAMGVKNAYRRIKDQVKQTPLSYSPALSKRVNTGIYLKKEHLAVTGSYKERGALNKLLQLTEEEKKRGVISSSAGNHAQAVSHHATRLGINAIIVMPETTPYVKVKRTQEFGATVVLHGNNFTEAYEKACELADKENRVFVHAFNDTHIVEGQGTVALELLEQNPYLDAVIVPIGGGGLIAGMLTALKAVNPRIRVYGVEATLMPSMHSSLAKGEVFEVPRIRSIADGIAVSKVGEVPFEAIKEHLEKEIVLVDENEIAAAVLYLLEVEKSVVEASGAAPVAALLSGKIKFEEHESVGVVLTGGNIDMTVLGRIIEHGMVKDGRIARFKVTIDDTPGGLAKLATLFGTTKANVRDIVHERAFMSADRYGLYFTENIVTLETRGPEHIKEICESLIAAGYHYTKMDL